MKKILIALLTLFSVATYAQVEQQTDTLLVNFTNGTVARYLMYNVSSIDYTDAAKIGIKTYDEYGSPRTDVYMRTEIKNIEFRNRYSNPQTLLKQTGLGVYDGLFHPLANPQTTYYMYACLASDEMLGGGGLYDTMFHTLDMMQATANRSFWDYRYQWIRNINTILELADQMPASVDDATVAHTKGEALFMRAFYYYELASFYGNVPMITHNDSWEQRIHSTSPEEVWGQILLDLKEAIALMDGSLSPTLHSDNNARVGKYAAEALLARCYLFYAGFHKGVYDISKSDVEVQLPDGSRINKSDVIRAVEDCLDNSEFSLVSDYRNLWPYTNRLTVNDYPYTADKGLAWVENDDNPNPEVLFKIKFNKNASWSTTIGYANSYALHFGMRDGGENTFPFGIGWGAGPVSAKFYDEWYDHEPTDMRRDASIQNIYDLPNYGNRNPNDAEQFTPYHEKKISPVMARIPGTSNEYWHCFETGMSPDGWEESGYDNFQLSNIHPLNLIRLADVMLMHSELTGTVENLNKVRRRAGLSDIKEYSLEALQNERRWELAFEGVRWGDMRRWGDEYCKAALDRQQQQVTSSSMGTCITPIDYAISGGKTYSELYAVNRGFAAAPVDLETPCSDVINDINGHWSLGDLNGICYGTMKYHQTDIKDFLTNPVSNGLIKGYSLEQLREQNPSLKSELSPFSFFSITDNNATKYDVNGNVINSGDITFTETNDYDWRICHITLSNPVLPYCVSATGGTPKEFDLVMLKKDQSQMNSGDMILVESGKNPGDEVAFWVLSSTSSVAENMSKYVSGRKWSYTTYNTYAAPTWNMVEIGTWGIGSFNLQGSGYQGIYCPLAETTFPVDLKDKLQTIGITDTRDADPFAYMQFDIVENTVSKYTADGTLIAKGDMSNLSVKDNSIYFTVSNNAMLIPYIYNGKGETVKNFRMVVNPMTSGIGSMNPTIGLIDSDAKDMSTQWLFAPRGFKNEELADAITIKQYDDNGNETPNGKNLTITVGGANFIPSKISVTSDDPDMPVSASNIYYVVKNKSNEAKDVKLNITVTNDNGINATASKTVNIAGRPAATEAELLFTGNDDKQWIWDFDKGAWGNIGYQSGENWSTSNDGMWWGASSEDDFAGQNASWDETYNSDETKASSYMTFTLDGKITSYNANGKILRSGDWSLGHEYVNGYERDVLYTTPGSILFPYAYESHGYKPSRFEIMYLSDNSIALVFAEDGTYSWSQATFWRFKKK